MPRYLMDLCFKYQEGTCPNNDINYARRAGEIKTAKIPLFPSGKDQERLDQICEKCEVQIFEIERPLCPVCHGGIGPDVSSKREIDSRKVHQYHQYRCLQCHSFLYSIKNIE